MSLPRTFNYNQEFSNLDDQVLGCSAPPTTALSCSIDLPTENNVEATLSSDKAGSLLSVRSAPIEKQRPTSLVLELPLATQVGAYLSAMSPTEQEEDSLLTLSSVTARPLLAASRKLRPPGSNAESIVPPDGGYGWVVVFGAFMVQFWVAGLFKSYGVLYVEIMETFPDSSASVASWIPAALSTLCLALAPLSSALCEKYSCRLVVFIGGLFCASGLALSFFSTGLLHLLLSFGVMTGIGGGLSTTPGIVIVSQYFDKHRALANGICVSGTAAGSFVFPMLIEKLVDVYGLHGTVLLLGGGMLHVCVAATLYRPPPVAGCGERTPATTTTTEHSTLLNDINDGGKIEPLKDNCLHSLFHHNPELALNQKNVLLQEETKRMNLMTEIMHPNLIQVVRQSQLSDSEDSEGMDVLGVVGLPREVVRLRLRPIRSSSILHSVEDLSTDSTCVYKASRRKLSRSLYIRPPVTSRLTQSKLADQVIRKEVEIKSEEPEKKPSKGCVEKISRYLDVSLLKSWRFGLLCTSVALMSCGSPYALYYLPAYTVAIGHTKAAAGRLVAISAVLDLCGRLGLGWLCDLHLFCRRKAYIISIFVAGAAVLTLPSLTSWWSLAIVSGAYGLCLGCWFLLVPVLLADAFGTARIASSYGLVRMFQSVAAVSVPPTAGYIRDLTGGFSWCFYGMGSCMVLGTIPVIAFHVSTKNDDNGSTVD
ncbi:monocarboxylate transporter 12 [Bombyx mandarina]|uniref:Monocarboxylate transporter 12 n=2 Tax=Bombyx TaxID=7090 RepID=A0A8R2DLM0_BOMMO|nr:monocarboxylate transporter 12 [Bombyx mori]XP_028032078.1 monocarboxylate transporter 12 [Bombyx mandarina]